MNRPTFFLLLIWLGQSALVLLVAYWNPNHFTTIDSGFYLESAAHLLRGEGHRYVEHGRLIWNGLFPIGYPAVIALVSRLTDLSPLWASKVANLLASAAFLYLLRRWFGERKAVRTGCVLLLGQFVKLWAHTWSEPVFLVLLFAWAYVFFKTPQRPWLVFGLGVSLMLVRYAGVFIIPFAITLAAYNFWRNKPLLAKVQFYLSVGWALAFAGYLYLNLYQGGEWYGGDRFDEKTSLLQNAALFGQGLLNELFLFRDTDFYPPDFLFVVGLSLQLILVVFFVKNSDPHPFQPSASVRFAWIPAFGYLLFLYSIRLVSSFDAPGYRLLAPFSFLFFWGILYIAKESSFTGKRSFIGGLALLGSWLHLLPQTNVGEKLKPVLQWLGGP